MKRHVKTARCVDGPYTGQVFAVPSRVWSQVEYLNLDRSHYPPLYMRIGPLIWINNGPDKHCYQLLGDWDSFYKLVYRDSF